MIKPETNGTVWMKHFGAESTFDLHYSPDFPREHDGEKVVSYCITAEGLCLITATSMFIIPRPGDYVMIARIVVEIED